jgi:predicted NAD/FAD-binding protein
MPSVLAHSIAELPDVRTSAGVKSVRRNRGSGDEKVTVTTEDGASEEFDAVVLATHSDVTLAILGDGATEVPSTGPIHNYLKSILFSANKTSLRCVRFGISLRSCVHWRCCLHRVVTCVGLGLVHVSRL